MADILKQSSSTPPVILKMKCKPMQHCQLQQKGKMEKWEESCKPSTAISSCTKAFMVSQLGSVYTTCSKNDSGVNKTLFYYSFQQIHASNYHLLHQLLQKVLKNQLSKNKVLNLSQSTAKAFSAIDLALWSGVDTTHLAHQSITILNFFLLSQHALYLSSSSSILYRYMENVTTKKGFKFIQNE